MKPSILLVEDLDILRETAHKVLERAGYSVTSCENGKLGFSLYLEHVYDLIITDIFMPISDGYVLIERIKKDCLDHNKEEPKIIAVTGGNREIIAKRMVERLDQNVDAFLLKPFPKDVFLSCVARTLSGLWKHESLSANAF